MFKKLLKSSQYALIGFKIAWKEERNFQIELLCAFAALLLGAILGLSAVEFAIISFVIGFVLTIELLNTALEELCDKFHPDHDPHIAKIKDLAAAAVLVSSCCAVIIGAVIFGSHLLNPVVILDDRVQKFLYAARNPGVLDLFTLITDLGNAHIVAGVSAITVLLLWLRKHMAHAGGLLVSVLGTAVSVETIKLLIQRTRPDVLPTVIESSFSFPSGHAAIAVALYGFLTYLLLKNMKQEIPRTISICVGILLILAIGFSRLYLGVHFPTDIIGGYLVGGVWLCIGIYLAEYYGRKVTVSLE